jgi:transcription termination/antitermination protein NusG
MTDNAETLEEATETAVTIDTNDVVVDAAPAKSATPDLVIDATDAALDAELAEDEDEPVESPYDRPGKWYVLHTQSGYEKKVQQNLSARISSMNMEDQILEIVIPMEDVTEIKNGKKVVVQKKVFPGYLLVRCHLSDRVRWSGPWRAKAPGAAVSP